MQRMVVEQFLWNLGASRDPATLISLPPGINVREKKTSATTLEAAAAASQSTENYKKHLLSTERILF